MSSTCVNLMLLTNDQTRREQFKRISEQTTWKLIPETKSASSDATNADIAIVDSSYLTSTGKKKLATMRSKNPILHFAYWVDEKSDQFEETYQENEFDLLLFDPLSPARLAAIVVQYKHCLARQHKFEVESKDAAVMLQYYKNLLDYSTEAVIVLNENFCIDYCNNVLSEFLNMDSEELIGHNLQDYLDDGFKVLHHVYQRLTMGKEIRGYRVSIKHTQGKFIDANLNADFFYSSAGYVKGLIITMENRTISDLVFNQLLRREKFNVIKYLSQALAHEIHNPVNILMGRLQLMQKVMPEDSIRSMDIVHKQVDRIDEIISQLRKFNHNKEDSIPEVFGLIQFLEGILAGQHIKTSLQFKLKYQKNWQDILIRGNENQFQDGFTYLFRTLDNLLESTKPVSILCHLLCTSTNPPCLELQINIKDLDIPDGFFETFEKLEHTKHSVLDAALAYTIFSNFDGKLFIDSSDEKNKLLKLQFAVAGVKGFQQELDLTNTSEKPHRANKRLSLPLEDNSN
ncbi:MAG: PAS domain S-box protein [Calditrichia bacterium]